MGPPLALLSQVLIVLALGLATATPAPAALTRTPIGTFDRPLLVTAPPGDPHRIFVVERSGLVRIVRDGVVLPQPFVDVSADVYPGRTGLASMAFAPDYDETGHVYVLYAGPAAGGAAGVDVVLDEFTRGTDPDQVNPATRRNVLTLDFADTVDHDADHVAFGPDGLLYLTVGEGQIDFALSQDPGQPRGKVLRIDPRPDGAKPYRIPAHNPFADGAEGMPEVFAYGLRNPWRFSFDAQRRTLVIADVGDQSNEELSLLSIDSGIAENLGWPCWEGTSPHNTCTAPGHQNPVSEYAHTNGACSVIGGYTVRDAGPPSLLGLYVYGDFCTGEIRSINLRSPLAPADQAVGLSVPAFGLASFGEDGCGHLYAVHHQHPAGGNVWRIDEGAYEPCPERPALPTPRQSESARSADVTPRRLPATAPQPMPIVRADLTGPIVLLGRRSRRAAARGALAGTAADPSGVRSVDLAFRARRAPSRGTGCRWWLRDLARLSVRRGDCARPRWMGAALTPAGGGGVAWRLALGRPVPRGRYELLVRAVDGAGNVSRRLGGRARVRFRLP